MDKINVYRLHFNAVLSVFPLSLGNVVAAAKKILYQSKGFARNLRARKVTADGGLYYELESALWHSE